MMRLSEIIEKNCTRIPPPPKRIKPKYRFFWNPDEQSDILGWIWPSDYIGMVSNTTYMRVYKTGRSYIIHGAEIDYLHRYQ